MSGLAVMIWRQGREEILQVGSKGLNLALQLPESGLHGIDQDRRDSPWTQWAV